jgi:hypothetical protein
MALQYAMSQFHGLFDFAATTTIDHALRQVIYPVI